MTTVTARLTISIDGDGDTADIVAGHLARWLRSTGAEVIEAALLDEAPPEYDDDWDGDPDNVSDKMIAYDAWSSSYWRMSVVVDQVESTPPQPGLFADDQVTP